jgi:hypothetical protein
MTNLELFQERICENIPIKTPLNPKIIKDMSLKICDKMLKEVFEDFF